MGRRGPKPKTDEQRKHEGTFRHRPDSDTKPRPVGEATKPKWLSKEATEVWDRMADQLHKLAMLTPIDADAFALTCEWAALAERAAQKVNENADGYMSDTGKQSSPHLTAFAKASDMYLKLSDRFGLTPAARQSLTGFLRAPSGGETPTGEPDGDKGKGKGKAQKDTSKGTATKARAKLIRFADRHGRTL